MHSDVHSDVGQSRTHVQGDFVAASELKAQLDKAKQAADDAAADASGCPPSPLRLEQCPDCRAAPIRIASLGGGPGNDAVGCLLFAALCASTPLEDGIQPRCLALTVYDFCPGWEEVVKQVAAAMPAVMPAVMHGTGRSASMNH